MLCNESNSMASDNDCFLKIGYAIVINMTDNYFVIVTREDLPNLPYSVDEIYGIHTSGRYHDLKRTYNELYHIYSAETFYGKQRPEALWWKTLIQVMNFSV